MRKDLMKSEFLKSETRAEKTCFRCAGGVGSFFSRNRESTFPGCLSVQVFRLSLGVLIFGSLGVSAVAQQQHLIPEADIVALQDQLDKDPGPRTSAIGRRRDLKNTARKGLALVDTAPAAPNRFRVLGLVFQCQKQLLALDNSEKNRTAIFATCERLVKAPDDYAEERLEADLLLSDRDLSARDATLKERAEALAQLLERYRDTRAEAKSLLMAALIAQKLDAPQLEDDIYYALDEKFSDDHEVIEFRRKHLRISRLDVTFSGEFERIDGKSLVFPSDTMGHMSLMVFWSKDKPGIDAYLEKTKKELAGYTGLIDVFSFNLDGLADGGQSILRENGLDWAVMRVPGGREHQVYRTYAQGDPVAVLVNEYGLSVTRPEIVHGRLSALDPARVSEDRYVAQLQSLFIGDFLVNSLGVESSLPDGDRPKIQSLFTPPPHRYRLSRMEALENYRQAVKLCKEALQKEPGNRAIGYIRNCEMIALLGVWNLGFDPESLNQAVTKAKTALATELPPGGDIVPRFCLAKAAIRADESKAESTVAGFLTACGGEDAPAAALAAASILALDARSRELHEHLRSAFLDKYLDQPVLYAFTSFLRDRHHRYRLLRPNYTRRERGTRGYIVAHGYEMAIDRLPDVELRKLDGSPLMLPKEGNDKLTLLLFVEPPEDPGKDFPLVLDRKGNPTKNDHIRRLVSDAHNLAEKHINKGVEVVLAFLCDDVGRVDRLMKSNEWTCQAAMVPGGLSGSVVRQLGIYSADRLPNIFLLQRDGIIAWRASGYTYKAEFGFPFAFLLGMKVHIERCEVNHAYKALERGDFEQAAQAFGGPYLPWRPDRFGWRCPRYHGQALAYMGSKKWDAALESIEKAIDARKLQYFHGRRSKNILDWRKDSATVTLKQPDDIMTELWLNKAIILDKLGRGDEAAAMRKRSEEPAREEYPHIYKLLHEKLKGLRKGMFH